MLHYYTKIKVKGQVKSVSVRSSSDRRLKKKDWKKISYRDKRVTVRKNVGRLSDEKPLPSPGPCSEALVQKKHELRDLVAVQRRR